MAIIGSNIPEIKAQGANIIARFEDAELVAVLHPNGYVGIYAEDENVLLQMSPLVKSDDVDAITVANRLMRAA